jgi:flagellar biogenesis protein FliO
MKTAFAIVMLSSSLAAAEPHFEVIDRGTAVEVIAYEVKAARTAVNPARSRLEIDLVGFPKINPMTPNDKSIKVIELDGASPRRLSVKLPFERPDVKTMSKFAQAIQVGEDLHLLFPREVPAEGARVVLPEPTLPKEIAAKIGPQPVVGPQPPVVEKKPEAAAATTEAKPEVKAEPKLETKPEVKPEEKKDEKKSFLAPEEPSSNFSMYMMAGLGAIALGLWLLKKKKQAAGGRKIESSIDVIATKSLGSKAKVVWLNAGGREMVVAVTPQQVRMLGQWKKSESTTPSMREQPEMPFAQALDNATQPTKRAATSSPVAGILKLRERASTYEGLNDDISTGDMDADAAWAKEIMAATNAGGRR